MHVHLCGDSQDGALERLPGLNDAELAGVIERALRRQLAAGVTTVRDLGDRRWAVLEWRDRLGSRSSSPVRGDCVAAGGGAQATAPHERSGAACGAGYMTGSPAAANGGLPYPTIVASGPPITSPAGHCWHMGGEAKGADQLRRAVRERAERRVDVVKVMASGGNTTPGTDILACQFTLDELQVVVEEAHALGLPVTAHAHGLPAVEQAMAAGVDGIEHCSCLTPTGIQQPVRLLEGLAARQVAVCPTLGWAPEVQLAMPPAIAARMAQAGITLETIRAAVSRVHRAGVPLVAGSDAGIAPAKPHGVLPEWVVALVAAGVPAAEALASATSRAARACGLGDRKGRLRIGYDADLLLVDGDPMADAGALRRVAGVMLRGAMAELGC
jgi:imidazolonepropionase-like amidohydrolase